MMVAEQSSTPIPQGLSTLFQLLAYPSRTSTNPAVTQPGTILQTSMSYAVPLSIGRRPFLYGSMYTNLIISRVERLRRGGYHALCIGDPPDSPHSILLCYRCPYSTNLNPPTVVYGRGYTCICGRHVLVNHTTGVLAQGHRFTSHKSGHDTQVSLTKTDWQAPTS